MSDAEIGVIGLGTMGSALALNMAGKGIRVAVWNREPQAAARLAAGAGALAEHIVPCATHEELTAALRKPRAILMMIPSGAPVDEQIAALDPLLEEGDTIIDGGNSDFRDTERRAAELSAKGRHFLGLGVSGGEDGARNGPSLMAGGPREAWDRVAAILTAIAADYQGEPCAAWLGPGGAGHFVKTVHNGIEYADMQMIAEVYGVMRDGLAMDAAAIGDVFAGWNGGRLESYLVETTATVLRTIDPDTGWPFVDVVVDAAGQKGTGRWASIEAQRLGVPASTIEAAVGARVVSSMREARAAMSERFAPASAADNATSATDIIAELELALLAGKLAAYAQGFSLMRTASAEHGWTIPLDQVARIWRAGCIIRSAFLGEIARAHAADPSLDNLLAAPDLADLMRQAHPALRITVARAALAGQPVPALSAALAWFDGLRQSRGTANLIQAQRDFFGAHGLERSDREGIAHGPWHAAAGSSA